LIFLVLWGLLLAACLGFWRVVVGPTVPDRIVAADTVATIFTTFLVVLSLFFENPVFLDVALAFAVLSFADVLIMAKYFEHGELHK
jgi:multicomponent Na+:H+ antiporter subunit F